MGIGPQCIFSAHNPSLVRAAGAAAQLQSVGRLGGSRMSMTHSERFDAMQKEHELLRAEMDLNRKYIFERPLLIVAGGITAAATLRELVGFEVLPLVFIVLMGFNLWFTHNRLQSNSRIVAYMQLVHTPEGIDLWRGWEAALRDFRNTDRRPPQRRSGVDSNENRFYGPILTFHVLAVVLTTGFLLAQMEVETAGPSAGSGLGRGVSSVLTGAAFLVFCILAWRLRPGRVRGTIDAAYGVWEAVHLPAGEGEPANQTPAPGGFAAGEG